MLNVRQPWTELIAQGVKSLEVRKWTTSYRGAVLIVASRRLSSHDAASRWLETNQEWARGCAVCVVELVGVVPGRWGHRSLTGSVDPTGQYCWQLARPRRVQPVPVRGRLGLWRPDDALVRAVCSSLSAL